MTQNYNIEAGFSVFSFHPVMEYQSPLPVVKLSREFREPENPIGVYGAGGYLENRKGVYTSALYGGKRYIHMGVDFWGPAGAPVFAFDDGRIWGFRDNNNELDYGPTLVTEHHYSGQRLFALYGHLSRESLDKMEVGKAISKGEILGELGDERVNGGWIPHLHFQLSVVEPQTPDMPGVVTEEEVSEAMLKYPDPRIVLGPIYL